MSVNRRTGLFRGAWGGTAMLVSLGVIVLLAVLAWRSGVLALRAEPGAVRLPSQGVLPSPPVNPNPQPLPMPAPRPG